MDGCRLASRRGRRRTRRPYALAVLVALPLLATGCAPAFIVGGAAAGGGTMVWYRGWFKQTIDVPQNRVFRAARAALADFKVALEDETPKENSGVLDGYAADGRRVMVKTKAVGEKATRVRVRVGFWGDQELSLKILEQLKKHL